MCICSLNIAMSHTSRLESTLFLRREKAQNTESCAFSRVRTDVWERVQLSRESLACCVFLYRFQVLEEIEDDACALITKKGCFFSEKCLIQNYWICQGVIPSSTDNDLWIDHRYKSSCLKTLYIFVETLCFYNKYYCDSADNNVDVGHYPSRQSALSSWLYLRTEMTFS